MKTKNNSFSDMHTVNINVLETSSFAQLLLCHIFLNLSFLYIGIGVIHIRLV